MQVPNLVQSKTSQNQIRLIEWNPAMDLLATVFCNDSLTCSRLLSLQKVWHKPVGEGTIESVAWRPDGRVLAIGGYNIKTKDYTCALHDVENGHELNTIKFEKEITAVSWFQFVPNDEESKDGDHSQKSSKESSTQIKEPSDTFSHQLAHNQTQLNILLIATIDGKLNFYALGLFYLGSLKLYDELNQSVWFDASSKVVKTRASSCLKHITVLIQGKDAFKGNDTLVVKSLRLSTFHDRSIELLEISKMYARITDELEYLDDTMNAITTSWADVLAGLDNKLSSYCSRKSRKPDESQSGYTFISADELLQLLVIGYTSDNLEKFLADMSDKGLKKLNNAIEQTCLRVQNLIVKNAQKCCYHLHGDLNTLRELSRNPGYKKVGLQDKYLVDAMRSVGALMFKLTELQQVIDHTLKSSKSFFRWLISIACRMTNEQNNSMVPNDLNKTTQQDIQLITDFILDNFDYNLDELDELSAARLDNTADQADARPTCSNFTLEQIGQYLKEEQLSRLKYSFAKRGSNFWIEFFKQKQELTETRKSERDGSHVLTFYPHNENTSLIQEYRKTCQSVQSAFKSFATSMSDILQEYEYLFEYPSFLHSAHSSRVKLETELRSGFQYTMFQQSKKDESTDTHYVAAHQLNQGSNGAVFLLGIRFVPLSAPKKPSISTRSSDVHNKSNQLEIADSNFYENKQTKSTLLTFLVIDRAANDTLIVQLDLKSVLAEMRNDPKAKGRIDVGNAAKMVSEKFFTKLCRVFEYEIDLCSGPSARNHSSNLMVKKIKKTIGQSMFLSSGRGVIAFTSYGFKRLHLYELESLPDGSEIPDDEAECDECLDESLIDTDLVV